MKITIYDKYIFKQVAVTTFVAILLFSVVWIAPEMLLNTIKKILAGEYTLKMGAAYLTYQLPLILGKAFPVGLLLGSLFTFDKLSKDSELTIFRAVGLPFHRIIAPVIVLSLIVTWLCFVTYDKFIPVSQQRLMRMQCSNPVSQYIYTKKDEKSRPVMSVIVSRYDNFIMNDVIVLDFSKKIQKHSKDFSLFVKCLSVAVESMLQIKAGVKPKFEIFKEQLSAKAEEYTIRALCKIDEKICQLEKELSYNVNPIFAIENLLLNILEVKYICK